MAARKDTYQNMKFPRLLHLDYIPFSISLSPGLLLRKKKSSAQDIFPFDQKKLSYTYSGTAAIYQAAKAQNWGEGDEIICPAFNCGHELEPLLRVGVSVNCYAVGKSLEIDLESLKNKMTQRTRAILIVHYFGFPQPVQEIREVCNNKGVLLIEDCAHALFSYAGKTSLGSLGDLAIFSFRKSLPLPDGGGLLLNNPELKEPRELMIPPFISTWTKTLGLIKKALFMNSARQGSLISRLLAVMLAPWVRIMQFVGERELLGSASYFDPDDERLDFDTRILSWAMSKNSHTIIDNIDPEEIIAKRRDNFRLLSTLIGNIRHCRPVFETLPEGVCPLYFPVLVYNREEIVDTLQAKKIFAAPWWEYFHPAVNWDEFPEAVFLKDHMMILPIHQDIDTDQIKTMAECLREYFS